MVKLINCEQGTQEWFDARAGIVTASELSKVLAKGEGKTRAKYMRQLAAEIVTGAPCESDFKGNTHTERGKLLESDARELLSIRLGSDIQQVGLVKNDTIRMGCSPDGIVGMKSTEPVAFDSGVEIKCCLPDIQIERLMRGGVPSEYIAQVEGSLLVTGAPMWVFYSFSVGLPAHIVEVVLIDERKEIITEELYKFNKELDELVERVRNMF